MATLPEMQRQGAGRAILEHCMTEHVQNGVRLFYLWADESGFPLYEHFGFRTIADVVAYRWSP
jgi:predicted acetyltransferase